MTNLLDYGPVKEICLSDRSMFYTHIFCLEEFLLKEILQKGNKQICSVDQRLMHGRVWEMLHVCIIHPNMMKSGH